MRNKTRNNQRLSRSRKNSKITRWRMLTPEKKTSKKIWRWRRKRRREGRRKRRREGRRKQSSPVMRSHRAAKTIYRIRLHSLNSLQFWITFL